LLNLFSQVYVCPEADLLWLLFQAANGRGIKGYPEDGDRAMRSTVALCSDLLDSQASVRDRFFQMALRIQAAQVPQPSELSPLVWIGDKKPVQHADPMMREFLYQHFPDAKCIHLVRHPKAVVSSMIAGAKGPMHWMECWKLPSADLLAGWCKHEKWVIDMKVESRIPILTVRYSELTTDTRATLYRILSFLGIPGGSADVERCVTVTTSGEDEKYLNSGLHLTNEALEIVDMYGLRLS
jgi:hypothetical protein